MSGVCRTSAASHSNPFQWNGGVRGYHVSEDSVLWLTSAPLISRYCFSCKRYCKWELLVLPRYLLVDDQTTYTAITRTSKIQKNNTLFLKVETQFDRMKRQPQSPTNVFHRRIKATPLARNTCLSVTGMSESLTINRLRYVHHVRYATVRMETLES
jgi:hypothetical protein